MITAPVIGGLIGLVTNSLAIKMLFRPYKEIRIANLHVPFTPGLIPKEQGRIAHAIAQVISGHILDDGTILNALTSDTIREAYEQKYDTMLLEWKSSPFTCGEMLDKYQINELADRIEASCREFIAAYLIQQCQEQEVVRRLVEEAFSHVKEKMNPWMYKVGKNALLTAQEAMIKRLEELLAAHGAEFVGNYIDGIYNTWKDKPFRELAEFVEDKASNLKQVIWEKYMEMIHNQLYEFLSVLDIQGIIENRINEFDLSELEEMIMEISKKELHALVWFGGLLGIFMGFVNLLF